MPELLLELFSEEIPARMQAKAADDLKAMITNGLVEAGLTYEGAQVHATPRRLVLSVEGLNAKAADTVEERKGPRTDAPQQAIDGFLKSTGLSLDQLTKQDDKKGQFYIAIMKKPGRATTDVVATLVPDVIRKFPWPKSMHWGSGTLRWVRQLLSILCTFDGEVVAFDVDGIKSGSTTRGHRFLSKGEIEARRFEDYETKLHKAHVIVDSAARAETIRTDAKNLAFAQGLDVVEDEGLLKEVAGLVEWPVVLMGEFDPAYLSVPPEVIITTIKNNQKCFCLRDAKTGKLANKYLLVSNMIAKDGGKTIIAGNNKVIAARLSDAKFFWDQDRKTKLEELLPKLDSITFHASLGSQALRVSRTTELAEAIARFINAAPEPTRTAARISKADLLSGLVSEFPELQGIVGSYLALDQGADPEIAYAIRDQYKPLGPTDTVANSLIGKANAIADKLDLLVGFWAINERPTGSKDPFALRRAALGVIRSILEGNLRVPLRTLIDQHWKALTDQLIKLRVLFRFSTPNVPNDGKVHQGSYGEVKSSDDLFKQTEEWGKAIDPKGYRHLGLFWFQKPPTSKDELGKSHGFISAQTGAESGWAFRHYNFQEAVGADLLSFFADRLKVYLKDQGQRHDLIDAVFSLGGQDDLLLIVKRVEALSKFLETDDGKNLLAGVKRANNILKIEEKKDSKTYNGDIITSQLVKGEEKALNSAIIVAQGQATKAVEAEDFEAAMAAIAKLRAPVDAFFEHVTVNDKDQSFRENRLNLLGRIRAATLAVADFSKIEG